MYFNEGIMLPCISVFSFCEHMLDTWCLVFKWSLGQGLSTLQFSLSYYEKKLSADLSKCGSNEIDI
jgi:hypothetical protein